MSTSCLRASCIISSQGSPAVVLPDRIALFEADMVVCSDKDATVSDSAVLRVRKLSITTRKRLIGSCLAAGRSKNIGQTYV